MEFGAEFRKCVEHGLTGKGHKQKPPIEQEKRNRKHIYLKKNSESVKIIYIFFFTFFHVTSLIN